MFLTFLTTFDFNSLLISLILSLLSQFLSCLSLSLEVESHNPVPYLLYEPKQFRWMHMNQSDSDNTRQILFKVNYRFKLNGELIPVKSGVGGSFSVKLMFRKII